MNRKSPEGGSNPEIQNYPSEIVNLDAKFGFGHSFYEVVPGVIGSARTLAENLSSAGDNLKTNSGLMREFTDLAIMSQRVAGVRIEPAQKGINPKDDPNNLEQNLARIKDLIEKYPARVSMAEATEYFKKKQKTKKSKPM
jgi:hypothetical protein